jgi:PKD repeat protein
MYLVSILPNVEGLHQDLIPIAIGVSGLVIIMLFAVVGVTLRHALRDRSATRFGKANAVIRVCLTLVPAFVLSFVTPAMIVREPPLPLDIVKYKPEDGADLVAPVAVTFGLDRALAVLSRKGLQPVSYLWDLDGDGKTNEETVEPTITAYFERTGAFNVSVSVSLSDGSSRTVGRRLVIKRAVFSLTPQEPVVDQPIIFSVEHLVGDVKRSPGEKSPIREVRWDFDDDGKFDEIRAEPTVTHVFERVGVHRVSAVILQENQTQQTYRRDIEVRDPPPQPFDIRVVTEPKKLLSPPPFGTIFTLTTDEPLREVEWDFNDKSALVKTVDQHRVGHTFDTQGTFRVTAKARSKTGETAQAMLLVQVVEILRIPDLTFDGAPGVVNNKISGEAPLSVSLTPHTTLPLIDFSWEAPDATSVGSSENTLQAIYRHPGTYKLTLLASDPEGKAMRLPISIEVKPPSSVVSFQMDKKSGVAPFKVRFDASQTVIPGKTISGFEWLFGDEMTGVTRKQGIAIEEHTFDKPGKYPVKLVVYTTTNETYESSSTVVVLPPRLDACFIPSRTSGKMDGKPFGVSFDRSCSSGFFKEIRWIFDDGSESDDDASRVVHVFEKPGVYDVTLSVQDTTGAKSMTTHQITVEP